MGHILDPEHWWFGTGFDADRWGYFGDNISRLGIFGGPGGLSMRGHNYVKEQKVPLGHHYYGWGPTEPVPNPNTQGRREYKDELAWGGWDPTRDLGYDWMRGQGKGFYQKHDRWGGVLPGEYVNGDELWNKREASRYGQPFDGGHLYLLDINVSETGVSYEHGGNNPHSGANEGFQPTAKPTGMPDEWVCGGPNGECGDEFVHCAKYPGAGLVWVPGKGSGGSYKQCCFKGDVCMIEYLASLHGDSYKNAKKEGITPYSGPDVYDWHGEKLHDTKKDLPVINSAKDANLLQWIAPAGAIGGVGALGSDMAADAIGDAVGEGVGDVVGSTLDTVTGTVEKEAATDAAETGGGEVAGAEEEAGETRVVNKGPNPQKEIAKGLGEAANATVSTYGEPEVPRETLPTARAEPSVTFPHAEELKQPDRHAPVSDDSIKLEGVLIAVVGITAGALILRHYWPGK